MRVTRLEIFGFKSFLEKLILPLEAGFTGVVGPNGCGKSNIVDALRWILGETRASQLRGGALEDVIFNGTDKLRPLGLAEVTLSLRSSEKDFFSEIVSTLTKQGNQFAALLAGMPSGTIEAGNAEAGSSGAEAGDVTSSGDPTEGLSASALEALVDESCEVVVSDRPHLTVIPGALSEGAAGDSQKPNLEVLEGNAGVLGQAELVQGASADAAGVPVADAATENAGLAAEVDPSNADQAANEEFARHALNRFGWLRTVQEVQITRRLYRSGESEFFINRVPCRLKDIKELFRLVGLGTRAYTIVAQGEVGRIVTSRPEERRLIIEEAAGVSGFREKIATAERRLEETVQNLARLEDVSKEVQRQVNSLRVQASRAKARQQLKDRIHELDQALFVDHYRQIAQQRVARESALAEAKAQESSADSAFQLAHANEQEGRAALLSVDSEGDDVRRKIDSIQEELRERSERKSKCQSRLSEVGAQIGSLRAQAQSGAERKQTLIERRSESERGVQDLESKDAEVVQLLGSMTNEYEELSRTLDAELAQKRGEFKACEKQFRESRDRLVSAESRMAALEEQLEAASPVAQMKDLLQGGALKFGAAPKDGAFQKLVERLGSEASLFIAGLTVPAELLRPVQAILAERSSYLATDSLSSSARGYAEAIEELTVASDASAGQSSGRGAKRAEVPALGLIQKGAAPSEKRAAHADVPFEPLMARMSVSDSVAAAAERILGDFYVVPSLEEALKFFEERAQSGKGPGTLSASLVTPSGEILTDYSFSSAGKSGVGVLHVVHEVEALKTQATELRSIHEQSATQREALQAAIYETERRHGEAIAESRKQQARARELANQQGAVRGRLQAERRLLSQIEQDISRVDQQIANAEQERTRLEQTEQQMMQELAELERALDAAGTAQDLTASLKELRAQWEAIDARRKDARFVVGELAQKLELARNARERLHGQVSRCELELEKMALELDSLRERVSAEYSPEFWTLVENLAGQDSAGLSDDDRVNHRDEVQKIRARIAREGEVDSSSIERFEEEQKRLDDLNAQRQDLIAASETLTRTIEKLRETSEKRFLATFEAVRNNFSRLIPRLFGGGKGGLSLTDPSKPLETGIDIAVRPPGKKVKSIELMSGGEKALCAIALIVSMFMERPSPLCVLDEVDAPLDEANLVRFLSLLKDMSNRTQFLVVTHNKQTMMVSDHLIGVTMQQPGASTVVTVSLQEAFQHVA